MSFIKTYVLLSITFFITIKIQAQDTTRLAQLVETFLQQTKVPGLSMAIGQGDQLVYAQGFGYADVEQQIPMSTTTELRTASVAKVITATALGKLVSAGKLDLDAPIRNYIPYIAPQYADLTCRQLAGHTAGMTHRPKGRKFKKRHYASIRPTVELITEPLLFAPNTDYRYSTNAYNLLAAAIEGAAGKSYVDYLQTAIFTPLDMQQTYPENVEQLSEKAAQLYDVQKGKLIKEQKLSSGSYKLAGAGFRSTPSDLVKMMMAYHNGSIDSTVVADMFRSQQLKNGTMTQVGIGWRRSFDVFGQPVIEHAGNWIGARTVVVYYPKEQLTIALMINARCPIFIEETAHILAHVFRTSSPAATPLPTLQTAVQVTNNFGQDVPQRYDGQLDLDAGNGQLTTTSTGFLKANPIVSLGSEQDYALATAYGLFYLKLNSEEVAGKGYIYSSRNQLSPREKPAAITIY